eukprot:TRINITY_DN5209_c0_g1_i1.p1 TRINITY_DN5209_c0_g1~~TRINITY_DN5209_c0_g1_i1.p1  ORF type:complete len:392 (+),score=137.74 TRINITY_DN5209_c0_g1_i1:620-1795(+)
MSQSPIAAFEFATATRVVFGTGALKQIGGIVAGFGDRALVVTGKNIERARPLLDLLDAAKIASFTYGVGEEPNVEIANDGLKLARDNSCNVIIGFGGGSAIDTGKAIAAVLANGGDFMDYMEVVGRGKSLTKPSVPFIAVPTTAGTGAEVTRNSVLCSTEHAQKVSLRSLYMLPQVALVDPQLCLSMPPAVTASTGLDAFTQLLESFTSNKSNPVTDALCREGLARAARSLRRAFEHGDDVLAREDMCIASLFGGLALANSKLGAVHGFAGPLGGLFKGAAHGAVCAALLPYVIDVNVQALKARQPGSPYLAKFDELAQIITGNKAATSADGVKWIQDLCAALRVPGLSSYGVTAEHVPKIVDASAKSSSMQGNPIVLTTEELTEILTKAF